MDITQLSQQLTSRWIAICARQGRQPYMPSQVELATVGVLVAAIRAGPPALQAETRQTPPHNVSQAIAVINTIQQLDRQMNKYEDPRLLDQAIENMPVQELHDRAERIQSSNSPFPCFEDALADVLVKWFRDDFFVWADRKTEKCPSCDCPMEYRNSPAPTEEERQGGANRVELHACKDAQCSGTFRFARYNDLSVLMHSRVGRCGEFANVFTLFLRAIGLRAQYVWNREDHVWNSYFSPAQGRWIHLDSCEAARDQPLLYSKGWGKKMSYCLAFSIEGAIDVSQGYIEKTKWPEALSMRNIISEDELQRVLKVITMRRRLGLPKETIERLEREDEAMQKWLRTSDDEKGVSDYLEARQSGTEAWKEARGEAGPST